MTELYFIKFPTITYNNLSVRDISERVTMITTPGLAPMNYYPYELANNLRPDQISYAYYQDATLDWLIWITNAQIDPYYDWHLYEEDFGNYISEIYGDLATATQTAIYWRTNWPSDDQTISVQYFNNLDGSFKKYYEPVWGENARILSYRRKQEDLLMNTNKIVNYTLANTVGSFTKGDLLQFWYTGEQIGSLQCLQANSTNVIAEHIIVDLTQVPSGSLLDNSVFIRSRANNAIRCNISLVTNLVENIPDAEGKFWEAVSWYDYENEKNENNRFIDLLDVNQVMPVAELVRKALA